MSRILILKEAPYGSREEEPTMTRLMQGNYAEKPEACTICGGSPVVAGAQFRNPLGNINYTHHLCEPCADQYDIMHSADTYKGEPMDIAMRLLKRQTTLSAFDEQQIQENLKPENSNIFIAAKPGNEETRPGELSQLSDNMLAELAALKEKHGEFGITSATGNAAWDLEPSFMLTNVPQSARDEINAIAEKYRQDSIAVSEQDETGAKFVTPQGQITDEYSNMQMDPNAEYSTDFPTGQRLTFKSEPMDIAMRLLKDDNERKKIEDYFEEKNWGGGVDETARDYYFTMGWPLTPFNRMSDRQVKLFSQMIFNHGTDGQPTVPSYWREPFQEAGHDYATEILMGDGMEHIPDDAYDELIRYHQHYNDAVEALPGGPNPKFESPEFYAHGDLFSPQPGDPPSPLTHPHDTAQQKMEDDNPHWGTYDEEFQEHYGINHDNRQFTPQEDNSNWQDSIETGEPMDIAMRLLKERVSPEAKRHKLEYDKKYESSPERVKYREELNRERRRRHIMGQGGPDMSHTSQHTIVPEDPHTNRARHFKDKGTLL